MSEERTNEKQQPKRDGATEAHRPSPQQENALRQAMLPLASPFTVMSRFMEDLGRLMDGFGPGVSPRIGLAPNVGNGMQTLWIPAVEVLEHDGQLLIRADVPGLSKDQVHVEIDDRLLIISGERTQEHEDKRPGFYRSERGYGSFYRTVLLPEGTDPKQAKATFTNGVLEIKVPAPKKPAGKRLEIQDGSDPKQAQPAAQSSSSTAA